MDGGRSFGSEPPLMANQTSVGGAAEEVARDSRMREQRRQQLKLAE